MLPDPKLNKVPSASPQNMSEINLVSWRDVCESTDGREVAENCVSEILANVESFVGGEFHAKSSCSVIAALEQKRLEEESLVEDRRLANWKRWIKIREKESENLRKKLYRRRNDLLLNLDPNDYRLNVKQKEIIDKSAAGFGDLNFFKTPEKSRKELLLTLPRSERVTPTEIIYTQTPDLILKEQKIAKGKSLKDELMIQEEYAHHVPSMNHLALKGNSTGDGCAAKQLKIDSIKLSHRREKFLTVERRQALVIGGVKVDKSFPHVNILIDLVFEGFKMTRQTKNLKLENRGDIAINITFKKVQDEADDVIECSTQSFFFDKTTFRIIPGDVIDVPFHFYSIQVGVSSEMWILVCDPEFSQECEIRVGLFGHCKKKFKNDDALMKIEHEIMRRAAEHDIERTIKDLLQFSSADYQKPCLKIFKDPIELKFLKINPKLRYHPDCVESLKQIYDELCLDRSEWNCDVNELYKMILGVNDIEEQQKLYNAFMENLNQLKNIRQAVTDNDEKSAKFSMVRNVFGIFFEHFNDNMIDKRGKRDYEASIKKKFCVTVDKMIHIVES